MNKSKLFHYGILAMTFVWASQSYGEPIITGIKVAAGNATLTVATTPGCFYLLQRNDKLTTRYWSDSSAQVIAAGMELNFQDDATAPCRFWRVFEFPDAVFWYDWTYLAQDTYLSAWGFGTNQGSYQHLDKPFEWYIDQADTGAGSSNNCGPSSVTMALKWNDEAFSKTAEDARNWSYSWRGNGWWYTNDIIDYLNLHSVANVTSAFTGTSQLEGLIAEGKLLILCIDTKYLNRNTNQVNRVGRFYSYAGGHFLVVKGQRTVSGTSFLEVYDPNNWHVVYSDGTPKGRNRHLKASELASAINNWWPYLITVQSPGGRRPSCSIEVGLDAAS